MDKNPKSEETIFMAAIGLPAPERSTYVEKACAGDNVLQQAVEALLRSYEGAPEFLEKNPS
ncbi:MAG TPA: hypothetical protein VMH87_06635, partial [Pseudomonadales bacterium]|nr:hypothetical protein [Pseudomonadales bacterium]